MGNEGSVPQQQGSVDPSSTTINPTNGPNGRGGDRGGFHDAEGLEYQARAPPSSSNVPQHHQHHPSTTSAVTTAGGGGHPGDGISSSGGNNNHRSGRPLMGAVFTRRGNAHNQNSTGLERPVQTAASYPPRQYHHSHVSPEDFDIPATDSKGHPTRSSAAEAVVAASNSTSATNTTTSTNDGRLPGEELTYSMNPTDNSQPYQHHYHNHNNHGHPSHPQTPSSGLPQQPMYMQQQQLAAAASRKQHVVPNQQYYAEHRDQHLQHHRQQQQQPQHHQQQHQQLQSPHTAANGITDQHHNSNTNTTTMSSSSKKSSWRQKGIMNSMRNLSLGNSIRNAVGATSPGRTSHSRQGQGHSQHPNARMSSSKQQVNNWELQWDADDDDEEEEEEEEEDHDGEEYDGQAGRGSGIMRQPAQNASGMPPPPSHQQQSSHQQSRPGPIGSHPQGLSHPPDLDSGFAVSQSSPHTTYQQQPITPVASATNTPSQMMASANMTPTTVQSGGPLPPFVTPTGGVVIPPGGEPPPPGTVPSGKAHLVTATPEMQHLQPSTVSGGTTSGPAVTVPPDSNHDDDGVEWDTGTGQDGDDRLASEKPNVQQFLPLLRVLGKGSFGKVVLVQKRIGSDTGSLFAMKILKKNHLVRRRQIERTRTERKVLSVVNHPFIMKLHYAFQSPDKLYLVLDYCPGGELFFHLSRFRRFPERVARFYSAELLLALGHLHKRGIIYRDLKPENVLLDADGHVKLGDFGLAKAGIRHAYEGATSMCGTPEYMAPEVLAQQGHGFCVDYWGLGMLTYEMMTGLPPWYTTDRAKLFRRLRSAPLDIPTYFSSSSASFTSALLERNPRRRLGVTGIRAAMEHEYFKSISWRALYGRKVEAPIRPCEGWSPPETSNDDDPAAPPPSSSVQAKNSAASFLASSNSAATNNLNATDLDAATANFDNQFTRMPVESDGNEFTENDEDLEELHEDTFVGFTFDQTDRDELEAGSQRQQQQQQQQQQARQRTQHYAHHQQQGGHTVD